MRVAMSEERAKRDRVYEAFLERQRREGLALAGESDLLEVVPEGPRPLCHFRLVLGCRGLVVTGSGELALAEHFEVGVRFPPDYLRRAHSAEVLTLLGPRGTFHPNIQGDGPGICAGHITPGTPLVDLIYQVWELLTYRKATVREDDALNRAACAWARRNAHRFPLDTRPLKRRPLRIEPPPKAREIGL
jgi:hypothetical protein